ncbi:MAG: hypothetical protein FWG87_12000 [Defluviitaleaceae bacterium]|nr:hypothetical protein [Defluviitaleaceae bacterium]
MPRPTYARSNEIPRPLPTSARSDEIPSTPPDLRTFVNSGQITSINAERGNLGTDKSVPYKNLPPKKPANPHSRRNILICVSFLPYHAPSVPLCEKIFLTNNERR